MHPNPHFPETNAAYLISLGLELTEIVVSAFEHMFEKPFSGSRGVDLSEIYCQEMVFPKPQNGVQTWRKFGALKTLGPGQNGRYFADDVFKCIFLNENVWILVRISLKFVPNGPINSIPSLVQIMAWRRPGDKPLFEPMMVCLMTHIRVTWPQWAEGQ